ncbi:hypothetical protein TWF730_008782 [Orbilia blumenaviensis]|uniref:Dipeptidase n=1 Tax=Orbilia blumenaviensis TaxID=1796055 RepID=A0AAV9V428_9PEZI
MKDEEAALMSTGMEKHETEQPPVGRHHHNHAPEPFLQRYLGNPKYLLPLIGGIFLLAGHFNGFLSKRADVDLTNAYEVFKPHAPALSLDERADRIFTSIPLIDTHIDLPILARALYQNHIYSPNFTVPFKTGGLPGQVDLPRLKSSKLGGVFWSVFTPCPPTSPTANIEDPAPFQDEIYYKSIHDTIQQIDLMKRIIRNFPQDFGFAKSVDEFEDVFYKSGGKRIASVLGIEGLHQIGNSPAAIRLFHELGVRYITLTHNCNNLYADGAIVPAPYWNGLNPDLGPALIREFNRLGMIIDLSHVSAATMRDVLSISQSPVIFSHSSAFSLTPHPRNVPDDVLQLVKKNKGVVQINFVPDFVTQSGDGKASLEDVADHVVYIGEKIGWEYVGFGSDYDGSETMPEGLEDVEKYPQLVKELLRRGVKDEDVKKATGGNVLRVWREVERVAEKLQAEGERELEDEVERMRFEL